MPPTLQVPPPVGQSLAGFLDAYYRAAQNRRLEEALARQNALAELQARQAGLSIESAEREAGLAQAVPGMLETARAIPPQTTQPVVQMPTPPSVLAQALPEEPVAAMTPTPYGPAVSGLTESQLTRQLTPEQYQASLVTPAGLAMRKALAVEPDVQYEQRIQKRKALAEYVARSREWAEKLETDPSGAYLAEATAKRALLPYVDDQSRARMETEIRTLTESARKKMTDEKEKREAATQRPELIKAFAAHLANPDDPKAYVAFGNAAANATSDTVQKEAIRLLERAKPSTLNPLSEFSTAALRAQAGASTPGMTFEQALGQVKRDQPELAARAHAWAVENKRALPPEYQLAFYGRVVPPERASEFAVAEAMAWNDGLRPDRDAKAFNERVMHYVERFKQRTNRAPLTSDETNRLKKIHEQDSIHLRNAEKALNDIRKAKDQAAKNLGARAFNPGQLEQYDTAITRAQARVNDARRNYQTSRSLLLGSSGSQPAAPGGQSQNEAVVRQVMKDLFPDKTGADLTAEERQKIVDEVNRRLGE